MKTSNKIYCILIGLLLITVTVGYTLFPSLRTADATEPQPQEQHTYRVTWATMNDTSQDLVGYATKNADYTNSITCTVPNLKEIRFRLNWTDDKATFMNRAGLDTLSLDITSPDGTHHQQTAKSAPRTKQGAIDLIVPLTSNSPASFTVHSRTIPETEQQLQAHQSLDTSTNLTFLVRISVQIGEIRPLKRLADKGNSFVLHVTPSFYTTVISTENLANASDPLTIHIKGGPLTGYPPLSVSFNGNPDNDSRIVSYSWEFGPPGSSIVPASTYQNIHGRGLPLLLLSIAAVILLGYSVRPSLASALTMTKTIGTMGTAFSCLFASMILYQITYSRSVRSNVQYASTEQNPTIVFLYTGNYWAKLTVTDEEGNTASDVVYITALQYVYPDNDHD